MTEGVESQAGNKLANKNDVEMVDSCGVSSPELAELLGKELGDADQETIFDRRLQFISELAEFVNTVSALPKQRATAIG